MAEYPALDLRWRPGPDTADLLDLLSAALDDFAPLAILDAEEADGWRVFFRSTPQRDDALATMREQFGNRLLTTGAVEVPDEDWARRSQANLTPIVVGRITVTPPWFADPSLLDSSRSPIPDPRSLIPDPRSLVPDPRSLTVVIDPSTGFGTGHHETTRLCLALLQEIETAGRSVIDVGTGSGVLAIAAAALGARPVIGIDDDPDALRNARENAERNRVSGSVDLREADVGSFGGRPADIVLANLTAGVLIKHASTLTNLVGADGVLVISGFGPDERNEVTASFALSVARQLTAGAWMAVELTRSPRPRS